MNKSINTLTSWIPVPPNSDFPIQNIPFGIFSVKNEPKRIGTRIGDTVIDLVFLHNWDCFRNIEGLEKNIFLSETLNPFIDLGKKVHCEVRELLIELFSNEKSEIHGDSEFLQIFTYSADKVTMHLPVEIGDYTDFYSSIEHATNVGMMFRDPKNALLPNWRHIPIGYHGRASSIVSSGTDIHRPVGQVVLSGQETPVFKPSGALDFELEMAFITSKNTELGSPIPINETEDAIFGMLLFNDLSARDIQKWEYVPLGPFLGKSFGSVLSAWVVTLEALEPFRVPSPIQEPEVLPYLKYSGNGNIDIQLEVHIQPENKKAEKVSHSNTKYLYWNIFQQLAHQTSNGCNIKVGDLYASGTISGPTKDSFGSLLELTWSGKNPLQFADGTQRTYLEDNDTVLMKAYSQNEHFRIGFGDCTVKILPAKTK